MFIIQDVMLRPICVMSNKAIIIIVSHNYNWKLTYFVSEKKVSRRGLALIVKIEITWLKTWKASWKQQHETLIFLTHAQIKVFYGLLGVSLVHRMKKKMINQTPKKVIHKKKMIQ